MISESKDEMAWRLAWSSQWRLQQESRHIEPTLPKMIGHLSVYNHVSSYMQTHDVSDYASPEYEIDTDVGQVEDILLGGDEDDDHCATIVNELSRLVPPKNATTQQPTRPALVRSSSVVTVVEIDDDEAEAKANPFSDDQESPGYGDEDAEDDEYDDDGGWSSDDETEFDSVSSVEDETEIKDPVASKLAVIDEEEGGAKMQTFLRGQTT